MPGLNRYTLTGTITPTYDARGNLTSAGGPTYGYSFENHLTSASGIGTLSYDPLGRLYETSTVSSTMFVYDGADMIAEYDMAGGPLRRYVHGPGVDEPLLWYEGSGTTDRRWLMADERGSIVAVTDGAGNVTHVNSYDEYGIPGTGNAGRFQYTGQAWLPEFGLYHYKARAYSPTLGRFLQTDPIGYEDGMNMYAYVGNDPVNATDPSGMNNCNASRQNDCPPQGTGGSSTTIFVTASRIITSVIVLNPGPESVQPGDGGRGGDGGSGGDGGAPVQPGKEQPFTCTSAMKEAGVIGTNTLSVSGVLGIGLVVAKGTWTNQKTGTHGNFTTFGFGAGFSAGATLSAPSYSSIGAFTGMSDGLSIGASVGVGRGRLGVGGGYARSWNNSGSGGGATFDVGSA